jgi:peroxidase
VFDNQYFKDTNNGRGLFTIDAELPLDSRTALIEQTFANDEQAFFDAMISAYVKMTSSRVLTGDQGQIRQNCRMVNSS